MIDIVDIVRPGDRVDIEMTATGLEEDREKKYYITKVYDITDEGDVEVFMPMEKTRMIVLSMGVHYDLYFYAGKRIYTCEAEVIDRRVDSNVAVGVLTPVTELEKRQRREYYRYDCILGMNTRLMSSLEEDSVLAKGIIEEGMVPKDKSVIVDLSGGGCRFVSQHSYEVGRLVQCRFVLNLKGQGIPIDCFVRILNKEPVSNKPSNTEYRCQFVALKQKDRENIISYIFEEERRVRAKVNGSEL